MAKKVAFGAKKDPRAQAPEEWVREGREEQKEANPADLRRLTLDLPKDLHRAIKRQAVEDGTTMVALLRDLLFKHFKVG